MLRIKPLLIINTITNLKTLLGLKQFMKSKKGRAIYFDNEVGELNILNDNK